MKASRGMKGRLVPTGECWCGCGEATKEAGHFFLAGHDRLAESAVINIKYGGVAELLIEHGFGPGGLNARAEIEKWIRAGGVVR